MNSNEKVCRAYFEEIEVVVTKEGERQRVLKWRCKCGNIRMKGNGWSNLFDHIKAMHPKYREELHIDSPATDGNKNIETFLTHVSLKARNIHSWMQWVVNKNKPLTFVEEPDTRTFSNLEPICRKTLSSYMEQVINGAYFYACQNST